MPKDIHTQDSSQQRASRLLLAMGVILSLIHICRCACDRDGDACA